MARFASVGDDDINKILFDKNSVNTKKSTSVSWAVLLAYVKEKKVEFDIATVTKEDLGNLLRTFYIEVRKQDGSNYSMQSLKCIRSGIQRNITETRPDIDIMKDVCFVLSNEVFNAQCVHLKKSGMAKVTHKPPISPADMKKLYTSTVFDCKTPQSLQHKVFFDVMLFLCRRGQENLRQLKISNFVVKVDGNGREFVEKCTDEMTKNRRESDEAQEGGIIYETDFVDCPVKSFKTYIKSLNPKLEYFFQRPKRVVPSSVPWFDAQVLGVNTIGNLMKEISIAAHLSVVYTNHCIRATSVTILDNSGIEARHIMSVSGHRSENSIRSYARTGVGMKRKMSEELASFCHSSRTKTCDLSETVDHLNLNCDRNVHLKKPLPPRASTSANYVDNHEKTFDLGVNINDIDDEFDDNYNENENSTSVESVPPSATALAESNFHNNNVLQNKFRSNMSSIVGDSAHYVEFSNCTFNF